MSDQEKMEPIAPTSLDDFSANLVTLGIGAVTAVLFAAVVYLLIPSKPGDQLLALLAATLVGVSVFLVGFLDGPIDEKSNAIPLFFGKPIKGTLPNGIVWWPPKWLGFGRRASVPVSTQQINIQVGNVDNLTNVIYASDRTPLSFDFELTGRVYDLWRWDIEYSQDPKGILQTVLDRTARWFANHFPASELVGMQAVMSQAIIGEIDTIEIDGEEIQLPDFGQKTIMKDILKTGFEPERLYVQKVNVPKDVAQAWALKAKEEGEREGEAVETQNLIARMQEMKRAFPDLSDQEILEAVQAERGKIDKVVVSGSGGDFTKGAALQTSPKRKR